jgi:hypothetical protein
MSLTPREKAGGGAGMPPARAPASPGLRDLDPIRARVGGAVTTLVPLLMRDQIDTPASDTGRRRSRPTGRHLCLPRLVRSAAQPRVWTEVVQWDAPH